VRNGAEDGSKRVSSAVVYLDGTQVFLPSAFSQQVDQRSRRVDITPESQLNVELRSKPGSEITIWIDGKLKPGRALIGPEGGSLSGPQGTVLEDVELDVPPGAFQEAVIVALLEGDVGEFEQALLNDPLGLIEPIIVGPIVDVQASAEFQEALTLRLPYDPTLLSADANPHDLAVLSLTDDGDIRLETGDPEFHEDDSVVDLVNHKVEVLLYDLSEKTVAEMRAVLRNADKEKFECGQDDFLYVNVIDAQRELGLSLRSTPQRLPQGLTILHGTQTAKRKTIAAPLRNGYNTVSQAHYYVDRRQRNVLVFPKDVEFTREADDTAKLQMKVGEQVQLEAEARTRVFRLVDDLYRAHHISPLDLQGEGLALNDKSLGTRSGYGCAGRL